VSPHDLKVFLSFVFLFLLYFHHESFKEELILGGKDKKVVMKNFEGQRAIPFNSCDVDGNTIRLDNYQGNWLLMVFHRHLG
jgi:hypothetical protein